MVEGWFEQREDVAFVGGADLFAAESFEGGGGFGPLAEALADEVLVAHVSIIA